MSIFSKCKKWSHSGQIQTVACGSSRSMTIAVRFNRTTGHLPTPSHISVMDTPLMPSYFDPPYQTKLRGVVLPLMTAAKIDPLEPRMHETCRNLISQFKDRGWCDVIGEFARRYPITIFGELFGLEPARQEEFRQLAETFLHVKAKSQEAWSAIRRIVREELEDRRVMPRNDMLTGISNGTD